MKQYSLYFFVALQLILIFLYINKENSFIKILYEAQKNKKILYNLEKQKQNNKQQLLALQNAYKIKNYAINTLKMEKVNLESIKTINKS